MADAGDFGSGTWLSKREGASGALRIRKCRLEVTAGPDKGKSEILASSELTIGRDGADFVLSDKKVSHLHAEIRLEKHGYRLRDLGSTNGTFVWGMSLTGGIHRSGCDCRDGRFRRALRSARRLDRGTAMARCTPLRLGRPEPGDAAPVSSHSSDC